VPVTDPGDLAVEMLAALDPRYVFFPHWSHRIDSAIFERFECVIFHMTDLPFGRGGSPLQNLIARGIY
jgi:methionyl-tRNA formyltransferase